MPRVVETADELQKAANETAQDIEIRAHLDLRTLVHMTNPAVAVESYKENVALLYVWKHMRSMRVRPAPHPQSTSLLHLLSSTGLVLTVEL